MRGRVGRRYEGRVEAMRVGGQHPAMTIRVHERDDRGALLRQKHLGRGQERLLLH